MMNTRSLFFSLFTLFFSFSFILFIHNSYAHGDEEHAGLPSKVNVCHSLSEVEKEPCYASLCEYGVSDECMEDMIDAATEGSGPKFANAVLHDLVEIPLFVTDGYMLAQRIGRMLFEQKYSSAGAGSFPECSSDFWYGCYYGFFDAFLTLTGITPEEAAPNLCSPSLDVSGTEMCYHKMGHMFMKHGDHILASALSLCDNAPSPQLQSHCWSGVFMENVNEFFISNSRGDGFSNDDPLAPCNGIADTYRSRCYENHGRYLLHWFADSPSGVSNVCSGAEKYAEVCQHSVAAAAAGADSHHTHDHNTQVLADIDEDARSWLGKVFDAIAGFFTSLFGGDTEEVEVNDNYPDHAEVSDYAPDHTEALSLAFPNGVSPEEVDHAAMITYEDGEYAPNEVTVRAGQRVLWMNKDQVFWPAANLHPTHKEYPGSNIIKCSTNEREMIFDACKAMGPNAAYSFQFDKVGEWRFHDHINPRATGTVIVSE